MKSVVQSAVLTAKENYRSFKPMGMSAMRDYLPNEYFVVAAIVARKMFALEYG